METAHELNRELTGLLMSAGQRAGYEVISEYPLPGARLDVVWAVPAPLPGVEATLPVVGFEIESSWRTRKHIKGDLLNLQDAGVALGVIVLAGSTNRDDALRRFSDVLVARPGPRILIWTSEDVRSLGSLAEPGQAEVAPAQTLDPVSTDASASHVGKYVGLWRWLRQRPADQREVRTTFKEIEQVLGFPLPASSRAHPAHWSGYDGSAVARAIRDAGWRATQVDLPAESLVFVRL